MQLVQWKSGKLSIIEDTPAASVSVGEWLGDAATIAKLIWRAVANEKQWRLGVLLLSTSPVLIREIQRIRRAPTSDVKRSPFLYAME